MKITIHYSEQILKSAVYAYMKRVYLRHLLWPTLLSIALLAFALYHEQGWIRSLIVVTVLFIPSVVVLGYRQRIAHSLKILQQLDDGRVDISLSDEGISASSGIGTSLVKWKMFADVWDTPDAALIVYTNHQFITLPKSQVPGEFIEAVRQKIAEYKRENPAKRG